MKRKISLILALFIIFCCFPTVWVRAVNVELGIEKSGFLTEGISNFSVKEKGNTGVFSGEDLSIDPKESKRRLENAIRERETSKPLETPIFSAALSGEERFTVLVLDTSGSKKFLSGEKAIYTADSATELVIQSAETFVKNLYFQGGFERLAIVTYDKNAKTVLNFSGNSEEILERLKSISRSDHKVGSIDEGLKEASRLLRQVPREVAKQNKNVVLISTGMTNIGDYDYQGHYNENVIGNDWHNTTTGVHLYAYANKALATAYAIKAQANLYSLGLFQNFDQMPSEGLDVVELFRLTARDLASSFSHYVEVRDTNRLGLIFENTANKILDPLKLNLTGKADKYGEKVLCSVKAIIRNVNKANKENSGVVRNVKVSLELPEGAMLEKGQTVEYIGDVPAYQTSQDDKQLEWTFSLPVPEDGMISYAVRAKGDNTEDVKEESKLYYQATSEDNQIRFGLDQWRFCNCRKFFNPKSKENYYLSERDWRQLTRNLTPSDIANLRKRRDKIWGGSCYGMSFSVVLAKMKDFQAGELQSGKKYLHEVEKGQYDDDIESFINYYQLSQSLPNISSFRGREYQKNFYGGIDDGNRNVLKEAEEKARKVKKGGAPVMISIWFENGGGHAIVGYGVEEGSFYDGRYNTRILIYDPNYPEEKERSCIYYSKGTSNFLIPNYKNVKIIGRATSDYQKLNPNYSFQGEGSSYSRLYVDNLKELSLHTDNGKVEHIKPLSQGENYFTMPLLNGEDSPEMEVFFTNFNDRFHVEAPEGSENYCLTMDYGDRFLSADTYKGKTISFDPSGVVNINGQRGDFEVSVIDSSNQHMVVSGKDAGNLSMADTSEGVKISATSQLKEVTVTVDDKTEQTVSTEATSILIKANSAGAPVVMSDEDHDGTYETKLESYSVNVSAQEGGQVMKLDGQFGSGASVTVEAIPYDGYTFDRWEVSEGAAIIGKEAKATFVMPNSSVSLIAHFKKFTDMPDVEFFDVKGINNIRYEWKIKFNSTPLEEYLKDEYFFVINESGYRNPDVSPILEGNIVKMINASYERGKAYYLVIRRGVKSQNGKELKKDVIFKFYVK